MKARNKKKLHEKNQWRMKLKKNSLKKNFKNL